MFNLPQNPQLLIHGVSRCPSINFFNVDCIEFMKSKPDKSYDLAIVDPPYGIGGHKQRVFDDGKRWDNQRPTKEYFIELQRVSKNQIIWGGNYFAELWPCKGFIIWDKRQPEGITFAMVELAACTIDKPAKMYFTKPAGERGFYTVDSKRIHPTQKPIDLYRWLLQNYATKGMSILDTHGGSMSIAKACEIEGFDLDICEIDLEYFQAGVNAFNLHKRQQRLF